MDGMMEGAVTMVDSHLYNENLDEEGRVLSIGEGATAPRDADTNTAT